MLTWGECVARGAQKKPDLVEGIALAPAVTGRVLLDAATHLIKGVASELDDVKGIEDAGCVLELVIDGVLAVPGRGSSVAIWIPERKSSPRSSSQFSYAVPDLPGTRSTQAGRGMIAPACQIHDAGELTRAPGGVGPGGATRLSSTPSTRTPAKRAGSSDAACRHGLIWDHTVFHVVASRRANPAMVAPSKRNCRIAQRIARTPKRARGAHTRSSCSRNVTIWQVRSRHIQRRLNHRIRAGTPAQGASITSTTTRPCLVRSPHNPGSQQSDRRPLCQAPEHTHVERQRSDGSLQVDEQITPITTIKRH